MCQPSCIGKGTCISGPGFDCQNKCLPSISLYRLFTDLPIKTPPRSELQPRKEGMLSRMDSALYDKRPDCFEESDAFLSIRNCAPERADRRVRAPFLTIRRYEQSSGGSSSSSLLEESLAAWRGPVRFMNRVHRRAEFVKELAIAYYRAAPLKLQPVAFLKIRR